MGRWGHCLFEADNDQDRAYELALEIAGEEDGPESEALCSFGYAGLMADGGNTVDKSALESVRQKLDAGLGDKLIGKYRALAAATDNSWNEHEAKYKFVILGALLMGTGAKIRDHDLQHLRQLASEVQCNENFALAFSDTGFRGPGKRQFLAALDNYTPGTPRSYNEPSCHACGKSKQDTGKAPLKCSGCPKGWFCDKLTHE
ncbi:hypothetical protein F5144DRAFT_546242 [Chaetomium tenue]|uniref:Uncharacterized protein n=1 Tax=Chaetomium tenue TaxID=1854479 RepID=A0ACB7PA84_9PEZI|nr:hypothetical protein F5144DRAFT_546242 [Chaetomium globosum]